MTDDQVLYDPALHRALLTPEAALERLRREHAIRFGAHRLAGMRAIGGGPQFIKPTQRSVRYPVNLLDEWAAARNRKPILDFVPLKVGSRQAEIVDLSERLRLKN
jgi:hypothetical protein